jgi:carbonic anhydrase/acetyltransferase-like protein (isoleucine patch superfamily)
MIQRYGEHKPVIGKDVRVHETAVVMGRVFLADGVNVWPAAVLRGDCDDIRVGARTNLQDNCVVHNEPGIPAVIGEDCVVGHQACVHGCVIGDRCLIGIHATVLTGARVGDECIIGAGALVPEGRNIPPRSLVVGVPGKVLRSVTDEEVRKIRWGVEEYLGMARQALPIP